MKMDLFLFIVGYFIKDEIETLRNVNGFPSVCR